MFMKGIYFSVLLIINKFVGIIRLSYGGSCICTTKCREYESMTFV